MSERERLHDRRHRRDGRDGPAVPPEKAAKGTDEAEHPLLGLQGLVGNRAVEALLQADTDRVPAEVRGDMERSFGRSFDDVRLHEGQGVDQVAEQLDAAAFTVGDDVYLHSSTPAPDTPEGRVVIGEELAHVAQGVGTDGAERVLDPASPAEAEAHRAAVSAAHGEPATVTARPDAEAGVGRILPLVAYAAYKQYTKKDEEVADENGTAEATKQVEPQEPDPNAPTAAQVNAARGTLPILNAVIAKLQARIHTSTNPEEVEAARLTLTEVSGTLEANHAPNYAGPIDMAFVDITKGGFTMKMALDPTATMQGNVIGNLETVVTACQYLVDNAKEPPAPVEGQAPPERTNLTPAEATTIDAVQRYVQRAIGMLQSKEPDLFLVDALLDAASATLLTAGGPPSIAPHFRKFHNWLESVRHTLKNADRDLESAINLALVHFCSARDTIAALQPPPEK